MWSTFVSGFGVEEGIGLLDDIEASLAFWVFGTRLDFDHRQYAWGNMKAQRILFI